MKSSFVRIHTPVMALCGEAVIEIPAGAILQLREDPRESGLVDVSDTTGRVYTLLHDVLMDSAATVAAAAP